MSMLCGLLFTYSDAVVSLSGETELLCWSSSLLRGVPKIGGVDNCQLVCLK